MADDLHAAARAAGAAANEHQQEEDAAAKAVPLVEIVRAVTRGRDDGDHLKQAVPQGVCVRRRRLGPALDIRAGDARRVACPRPPIWRPSCKPSSPYSSNPVSSSHAPRGGWSSASLSHSDMNHFDLYPSVFESMIV